MVPTYPRPAARSFPPLAEAGFCCHGMAKWTASLGITWRLWASLSIMPCCQALGRVGAFQKLQDPVVFVNDLHGAAICSNGVKSWFGATMRSVMFSPMSCVCAYLGYSLKIPLPLPLPHLSTAIGDQLARLAL